MSGTITNLFYQMRHGDQDAASDLLNHFLPRLKNQLQRTTSNLRIHDEDDIAVSAFYQFCKAVEKSRFRDISDRTELWRVLWMFASYQANDCRKNESAKFRGGDSNIVSVNLLKAELGRFDNRPDLQLELIDECDRLLGSIEDSKLRNVAELKLHRIHQPGNRPNDGCGKTDSSKHAQCNQRKDEKKIRPGLCRVKCKHDSPGWDRVLSHHGLC